MRTREDIESYLLRSQLPYEEVAENMWMVQEGDSGERIIVSLTGPLLLFRVKVMGLEETGSRKDDLLRWLLEMNATEMVHGSYGIADEAVVLTCALRVENLDFNEFQGTIDDFSLALSNHYPQLAGFRSAA